MRIALILLLLLLVPTAAAADPLTITPDRRDTYLVYIGFGEPQRNEYEFVCSRNVTSCEIPNATCTIEGHMVTVDITVDDNADSFESTLKVVDVSGEVATADLIVRIKDIGAALDITPINASCADMSVFVVCENEQITGIRWWVVGFFSVALVIAAGNSMLRD